MTPGRHNFEVFKGAHFERTFTWRTDEMVLVNLTGWEAQFKAGSLADGADPVMDLTVDNGHVFMGGTAGTIRVVMLDTETADLDFEEEPYSLTVTDPGNEVQILLLGRISLVDFNA